MADLVRLAPVAGNERGQATRRLPAQLSHC